MSKVNVPSNWVLSLENGALSSIVLLQIPLIGAENIKNGINLSLRVKQKK
jgi:hypothetical protein